MVRRSSSVTLLALILGAVCLVQIALQEAFLSGVARREVLGAAVASVAAASGVAPALADWQGEPVKMMQMYGPPIYALRDKVEKGDIDAVAAKLNKFDLFARGVYKNQAANQAKAVDAVDKMADAIEAKNKAGLKQAYNEFMTFTGLDEIFAVKRQTRYHIIDPASSMTVR